MNTDTFKNNKLVMGIIAVIIVIILIFVWNPFKGTSSSSNSSSTTTKSSTTTAMALVISSTGSSAATSSSVGSDSSTTTSANSAESSATAGSKFTAADIATHNSSTSCYVSFKNVVYDVTKYIPSHPGGKEILNACGKDLSIFNLTHKGGQYDSPAVKAVLDKYIIGSM